MGKKAQHETRCEVKVKNQQVGDYRKKYKRQEAVDSSPVGQEDADQPGLPAYQRVCTVNVREDASYKNSQEKQA